jgi:hypothetical protein
VFRFFGSETNELPAGTSHMRTKWCWYITKPTKLSKLGDFGQGQMLVYKYSSTVVRILWGHHGFCAEKWGFPMSCWYPEKSLDGFIENPRKMDDN